MNLLWFNTKGALDSDEALRSFICDNAELDSRVGRTIVTCAKSGKLPRDTLWQPSELLDNFDGLEDCEPAQEFAVLSGFLAIDRGQVPCARSLGEAALAFAAKASESKKKGKKQVAEDVGRFIQMCLLSAAVRRPGAKPQMAAKSVSSSHPPPPLAQASCESPSATSDSSDADDQSADPQPPSKPTPRGELVQVRGFEGRWARDSEGEMVFERGFWASGKFVKHVRLRGGGGKHARECGECADESDGESRRARSDCDSESPPTPRPPRVPPPPVADVSPADAILPLPLPNVPRVSVPAPFRPCFFVYCSSFMLASVNRPKCLFSDLY